MSEETFDLNDPRLLSLPGEEYDPEGNIEFLPFAPPEDGMHMVNFQLRPNPNNGHEGVYVISDAKGARVVVQLAPRFVKEDGELGGFLKDFYLSSIVPQNQTTSSLAMFCRLAGKTMARGLNLGQQKAHVEGIFAANPDGVSLNVKTRWIRTEVVTDGEGNPLLNAQGKKSYKDVKGMAKVIRQAQQDYNLFVADGVDPAEIHSLENNWHLYYDKAEGEIRTVRVEVEGLI